MQIEICSREDALTLAEAARVKTAVLSITSTDEPDVIFPENPNLSAILRIRLNDLTEEYDGEGIPYGRPLPQPEDLKALKAFVDGLDCECLIVHCWEGISRSAAIAAAIREARGSTDPLRTRQRFAPNPLVYVLACRALGIPERSLRYTVGAADDPHRVVGPA